MSELDDHPNLIKFHTSFLESDYLYILMEYANRGDLYKVSYFSNFYPCFH
jgi:serine/threonine protein kinase